MADNPIGNPQGTSYQEDVFQFKITDLSSEKPRQVNLQGPSDLLGRIANIGSVFGIGAQYADSVGINNLKPIHVDWDPNAASLGYSNVIVSSPLVFTSHIDGNRLDNSDDMDDPVLLHEFGHAVFTTALGGMRNEAPENAFDGNPGGTNYDPVVAFSEGFADAYQAIVRNSTFYAPVQGGLTKTSLVSSVLWNSQYDRTGGNSSYSVVGQATYTDPLSQSTGIQAGTQKGSTNIFSNFRLLVQTTNNILNDGDSSLLSSALGFKNGGMQEAYTLAGLWSSQMSSTAQSQFTSLQGTEGFTNSPQSGSQIAQGLTSGQIYSATFLPVALQPNGQSVYLVGTTAYFLFKSTPSNIGSGGYMAFGITPGQSTDAVQDIVYTLFTDDPNIPGGSSVLSPVPNEHAVPQIASPLVIANSITTGHQYLIRLKNKTNGNKAIQLFFFVPQ